MKNVAQGMENITDKLLKLISGKKLSVAFTSPFFNVNKVYFIFPFVLNIFYVFLIYNKTSSFILHTMNNN